MTDPYKPGEPNRLQRISDSVGRVSSATETITAVAFIVIGVGALIAASIYAQPLAALIGAVAIAVGIVRLLLQRRRR